MDFPPSDLTPAEQLAATVLAYYRLADAEPITMPELLAWYEALPPADQAELSLLSPRNWLTLPGFRRHVLERRGYSMGAYLAARLSPAELAHWAAEQDGPGEISREET
ncbi:hypothetical protein GCM10027422_35290 [Hymenobacter arcticus]